MRDAHRTASVTAPFLFWLYRPTIDFSSILNIAGSKIRRWAKITAAIDSDQIRATAVAVDFSLLRHSPEGGEAWQLFLLLPHVVGEHF
jgi:hypothetical protein